MAVLRVYLLGTPAIYWDEQPLQVERRVVRALLFYLACQTGKVGRDDLILMFWPDMPEVRARASLRDCLAKLRAALPEPGMLVSDLETVNLDRNRLYVDVTEFENLSRQTRRPATQFPRHIPLPDAIYNSLTRAVNLWRGNAFLAGMNFPKEGDFEEWALETNQRLGGDRFFILERLADHSLAIGDQEEALEWLGKALEEEPLDPNLNERYVDLLISLGRRGEAANYCNHLRRAYKDAGIEEFPEPLEKLRRGLRRDSASQEPVTRPRWPASLMLNTPFIGRKEQMQELRLAIQHGESMVLTGEAGSGKTRLIFEFWKLLEPQPRLLLAEARASETHLPFQPWLDLFRHSILPEEWQRLDGVWMPYLFRLLPDLAILRPDVKTTLPAGMPFDRTQLFEALHQVLLLAARERRILFLFENAHFSDEASLAALAYLRERGFFTRHGLLVLAARPETDNPYMKDFIEKADSFNPIRKMILGGLTETETAEMARCVLGRFPNSGTLQRLHHDTGGNPLFLLETLRAMLLDLQSDSLPEHLPLTGSLHGLIRERLRSLSPSANQVLGVAAVIGSVFTQRVLEETSNLGVEHLVQALDELERSRMITPTNEPGISGEYMFVHEKTREVVLVEISPARKRVLHQRVAASMEAGFTGEEQAAILAEHFEQAGWTEKAFEYWLRAARYASRFFSHSESYVSYRRAERLIPTLSNAQAGAAIYTLYRDWGLLARQMADMETLQRVHSAMLRLGEHRQDVLLIGSAYSGMSHQLTFTGELEKALALAEKADHYLEKTNYVVECIEVKNRQGWIYANMNRLEDAEKACGKAFSITDNSQDIQINRALATAHNIYANVQNMMGWPQRALIHVEIAEGISERCFFPTGSMFARNTRCFSGYLLGEYGITLEAGKINVKTALQAESWRSLGYTYTLVGRAALATGRLDEAWLNIESAVQVAERYHFPDILAEAHCVEGDFQIVMGNLNEALKAYQSGLSGCPSGYNHLDNLHGMGFGLVLNGDMERGVSMLQEAVLESERGKVGAIWLPALISHGLAYLRCGQVQQAKDCVERLEQLLKGRRLVPVEIKLMLLRAGISLKEKDARKALRFSLDAAHGAQTLHQPWLELCALRLQQRALNARDMHDPGVIKRVDDILCEIQNLTVNPEIAPQFSRYCEVTRKSFV